MAERFRAKWVPVRVQKTRQNKIGCGRFNLLPTLRSGPSGKFMQSFKALLVLIVLGTSISMHRADAQIRYGAQGPEGTPNRRQQWLVPSPDPATPAHALLFRPPGDGPFPLALIAH